MSFVVVQHNNSHKKHAAMCIDNRLIVTYCGLPVNDDGIWTPLVEDTHADVECIICHKNAYAGWSWREQLGSPPVDLGIIIKQRRYAARVRLRAYAQLPPDDVAG